MEQKTDGADSVSAWPRVTHALGLTRLQLDFLLSIDEIIKETGVSPTYQDLSEEFGISKSGAHRLVGVLLKRGWVGHLPGCRRSLVVLRPVKIPPGHYAPYEWSLAPGLQIQA